MQTAFPVGDGEQPRLWGLLAEFTSVEDLLRAAEQVRDAGFRRWDAHAPFPVHGLNDAMGIKMTKLRAIKNQQQTVLRIAVTSAT